MSIGDPPSRIGGGPHIFWGSADAERENKNAFSLYFSEAYMQLQALAGPWSKGMTISGRFLAYIDGGMFFPDWQNVEKTAFFHDLLVIIPQACPRPRSGTGIYNLLKPQKLDSR